MWCSSDAPLPRRIPGRQNGPDPGQVSLHTPPAIASLSSVGCASINWHCAEHGTALVAHQIDGGGSRVAVQIDILAVAEGHNDSAALGNPLVEIACSRNRCFMNGKIDYECSSNPGGLTSNAG